MGGGGGGAQHGSRGGVARVLVKRGTVHCASLKLQLGATGEAGLSQTVAACMVVSQWLDDTIHAC